MADLSTPALRRVIRRDSGAVLYTEMISATALLHGGLRNAYLTQKNPEDEPLVYQLIGNDVAAMSRAAALLAEKQPWGIDINMGCSAPEILHKGWGSALMRDRERARDIVRACRAVVPRLSVKIRSGWKTDDRAALSDFLSMLQDEGVDYITLHARRSDMAFRGRADWRLVSFAASRLSIPLVGNGDITDITTAGTARSGAASGIMIGRQAVREPWLFRVLEALDAGETDCTIDRARYAKDVLDGIAELIPSELQETRTAKFAAYFCTGLTFGHQLFSEIHRNPGCARAMELIAAYFDRNTRERTRTYTFAEAAQPAAITA